MLFLGLGKDQYIVQVYNTKVINQAVQCLVNIGLECGQCVGEAHGYHHEFIMAIPGVESCLLFITCFDSQVVVGILKVNFAKVLSSSYLVHDLGDQRQWILVLDCDSIQALVVNTQSQTSILLGCKENRCSSWALGFPDKSFGQIFFQELPKSSQLSLGKRVYRTIWWFLPWQQINCQINILVRCQLFGVVRREDVQIRLQASRELV